MHSFYMCSLFDSNLHLQPFWGFFLTVCSVCENSSRVDLNHVDSVPTNLSSAEPTALCMF